MAENNSIDKLFAQNVTKEQFVKGYGDFKKSLTGDNIDSVFTSDLDVNSAGELFKTLDTNNDGKLSNDEITKLRQSYDDKDNGKEVTLNDINELYSQTIERLGKNNTNKSGQQIYDGVSQDKTTSPMSNITSQLGVITDLKNTRKTLYEAKIQQINNELNNIVNSSTSLTQKEKTEYSKIQKDIQKEQTERKEKEAELDKLRQDMDLAKAEADYIQEHLDTNSDENKKKIKEATKEYKSLQSKYNSVSKDINKIGGKIDKLNNKQERLLNKVKSEKGNLDTKKNLLTSSLRQEESSYRADMQSYETQYNSLKSAEDIARANTDASSGYVDEMYQDEDTSHFSYDAKALKAKWSKSHPKLSDGFYNKTCEVAKRIGCDPNALMALMQSESGINSTAQNKSGATGLIQFMPKTARSLGTSTDAIKRMSPEQQLVYVERFLQEQKKTHLKTNGNIDSGTLYSLVLAPSRAKNYVMYTSGTAAYSQNKGLDKDGDGRITKADLRVRLNQFMPK